MTNTQVKQQAAKLVEMAMKRAVKEAGIQQFTPLAQTDADAEKPPFEGTSGRVVHNEYGTGTVMDTQRATEEDEPYYDGDGGTPFELGMWLCLVDWDDGGTTERLVPASELELEHKWAYVKR